LAPAIWDGCPQVGAVLHAQCNTFATLSGISTAGQAWAVQRENCTQKQVAWTWSNGQYGALECGVPTTEWMSNTLSCFTTTGFCQLSWWDQLTFMMNGDPLLTTSVWYQPTLFGAQVQAACNSYYYQITASLNGAANFAGVDVSIKAALIAGLAPWGVQFANTTDHTFAVGIYWNSTGPKIAFFEWWLQQTLGLWLQKSPGSGYHLMINNETMLNVSSFSPLATGSPTPAPSAAPGTKVTNAPSAAPQAGGSAAPSSAPNAGSSVAPTAPTKALSAASSLSAAFSTVALLVAINL